MLSEAPQLTAHQMRILTAVALDVLHVEFIDGVGTRFFNEHSTTLRCYLSYLSMIVAGTWGDLGMTFA